MGPPWYVAAAWLVAAVIAQATIVHAAAVHNVVPSLVLAVVVWYAVRATAGRAALYGLAAGFFEDALSAGTGASWMLSTCAVAALASALSRGFFADSIPFVIAVMAIATLLRALLFWVLMAFAGYPSGLGVIHFHEAIFAAGLNVAVIVVAMLFARRFEGVKK